MGLVKNFQTELNYMFNELEQSVTIKNITRSKDSEGNETETVSNSTDTTALIRHIDETFSDERFGAIENADVIAVFKPNETINEKDTVTINSVDYMVISIASIGLKGTTIYKRCILKKRE